MKSKQIDFPEVTDGKLLEYTSNIVASYLANNKVPSTDIAELIDVVRNALLGQEFNTPTPLRQRLRSEEIIEASVMDDYIICLEDGKKLKMLKRYLKTNYDMTPEQYRKKWGLPADYPMVAPRYAEVRSRLAKEIGLGKSPSSGAKKQPA